MYPQALDVLARPRESNLKVTRVGAEERLIEPVVDHLFAHPAEAAAALLDAMEVGKTLAMTGLREQGRYLPLRRLAIVIGLGGRPV